MGWIDNSFDDRLVCFPDQGTWRIGKKMSEKTRESDNMHDDETWYPSEAHAVYECTQVEGTQVGAHAILKIRIQ